MEYYIQLIYDEGRIYDKLWAFNRRNLSPLAIYTPFYHIISHHIINHVKYHITYHIFSYTPVLCRMELI